MRHRRAEALHDAIVVALVVVAIGVAAFLPRPEPARPMQVTALPQGPCVGASAEHRAACLEAARATLSR